MPVKFKDKAYLHNKSFVTLIGCPENGFFIKVVTMKTVKNSLVEFGSCSECQHYDEKMAESLWRSRNKIYELAMCNNWQFFFTATLDKNKYDRYDLDKFHYDLTEFFRKITRAKKYNGAKISFLLIPEQHKDGAWHMHGLLSGVPLDVLHKFEIGDKMSAEVARCVRQGDIIYNWSDYQNKFGFCTLGAIKDKVAVNRYITKYITKEVLSSVSDLNAQVYYRSRGLNESKRIKEGFMSGNIKPTFESEFCTVSELPYTEENLQSVLRLFL